MTPMEMVASYDFVDEILSLMQRRNQYVELEYVFPARRHLDDEDIRRLDWFDSFFSRFDIDYEVLTKENFMNGYLYVGFRLGDWKYLISF